MNRLSAAAVERFLDLYPEVALSEESGTKGREILKKYAKADGLDPLDALIAGSAIRANLKLATKNGKHFRNIDGLSLEIAFPSFSNKRQVSNAGGGQPVWRKDGRELFYLSADGKLMSVDIQTASGLETGPPKLLFQTKIPVALGFDQYTITGDGQRFLAIEPVGAASTRPTPIHIVLDWPAILGSRR